ncbi:hypothetical protein CVT24_000904 [Panaeolus cyanescens]|uniref:PAS domain-containing protein n=1 Tax=Panaeolus cyanescens TaxID=181874 RepID=A0A409YY09_9AGAR|nr:hypothetical protein CVT24_000904 [Panaeolus cyanescens]
MKARRTPADEIVDSVMGKGGRSHGWCVSVFALSSFFGLTDVKLGNSSWDRGLFSRGVAKWLYMTESVTDLLGFEPHELIGRPSLELVHPDEFPRVRKLHYDTIQQDKAACLVYLRMRHKDPYRGYVLCGVVSTPSTPYSLALSDNYTHFIPRLVSCSALLRLFHTHTCFIYRTILLFPAFHWNTHDADHNLQSHRTVVHNVLVGSVSFASPGAKALHNASTAQEITVITPSAANFEFRRWADRSPMPPSPVLPSLNLTLSSIPASPSPSTSSWGSQSQKKDCSQSPRGSISPSGAARGSPEWDRGGGAIVSTPSGGSGVNGILGSGINRPIGANGAGHGADGKSEAARRASISALTNPDDDAEMERERERERRRMNGYHGYVSEEEEYRVNGNGHESSRPPMRRRNTESSTNSESQSRSRERFPSEYSRRRRSPSRTRSPSPCVLPPPSALVMPPRPYDPTDLATVSPTNPDVITFPHLPSKSFRTAFILDRFSRASTVMYCSNDLLISDTTTAIGKPFYDFVAKKDEVRVREWVDLVKSWGVNEKGQPSDGGFGFGKFLLRVEARDSSDRMPEPVTTPSRRDRQGSTSKARAARLYGPSDPRYGRSSHRPHGTVGRRTQSPTGSAPSHSSVDLPECEQFEVDAIFSAHSDGLMVILRRAS